MSLNSYNLTKQSVVYGMFNQFVFNEVKTNIDLIERYFLMDVTTMGNNLIKSLLDAVRKYEFQNIDEPLFRSILASQGKTDSESSSILNEIVKYKMFDTYQIDPIRKFIRGIGSQSLLDIAAKKFAGDPEGYIKFLRTNEYKADYSDMFTVTNFDNIDINTIQANSMGGWRSAFDFINQSFQPMQKYENGQICMVVSPPGCFTKDTKVRLTDGTEITMEDLKDGIISGNEYYTYCKSSDGSVKKTKINACWISKRTNNLVEVSIDNGSKTRCTPDHKFMMRDGSYKEAKDLKESDSLMSYLSNHNVIEVKFTDLDEEVPVYDLNVEDESHNFLLADGEVFVHNCGKTLFSISECLNMTLQGARTHYLALGDMNQKDFVQRMGAMYSGYTFGDTMLKLPEIYPQLKAALGGRFNLTILPAAQTTVDEYIEYMMSKADEYDVLFVDYDSNFKPTQADNMYKEGGYIYDNLTKLTKLGKLVFVAAQPKIGSWRNETLELTDAGESSRKQHNVDIMITISKGGMTYNPNHIGRMKIAKNRRGEEGVEVPYIRLNNGRFRILTETLYSKLKGIAERRNYTDSDINQMLEMEQQAMVSQSSQVHQQQTSHNNPQLGSQSNNQQFDLQAYMASQLNNKP